MALSFKLISKYKNETSLLPIRKTSKSAGYDFFVAEDTLIPPYHAIMHEFDNFIFDEANGDLDTFDEPRTIEEIAALTKKTGIKPTLVPTGIKAELEPDTYLELSVRSSCPLKYWLIMGNAVGRVQ